MFTKLAVLLSTLVCLSSTTSCETADIQTIVGGDAFTVLAISSAVNLAGDILVGGIVQEYEINSDEGNLQLFLTSFLYVLKSSDCTVPWRYEFSDINVG